MTESKRDEKKDPGELKVSFHDATKELKDVLEVTEKLKARRRELKALLSKETVVDKEEEEDRLAKELSQVSSTLLTLEREKSRLYDQLRRKD